MTVKYPRIAADLEENVLDIFFNNKYLLVSTVFLVCGVPSGDTVLKDRETVLKINKAK